MREKFKVYLEYEFYPKEKAFKNRRLVIPGDIEEEETAVFEEAIKDAGFEFQR